MKWKYKIKTIYKKNFLINNVSNVRVAVAASARSPDARFTMIGEDVVNVDRAGVWGALAFSEPKR